MFRSVKRGLTLSMKYILNLGHQPISGLREYMRVFSWKFCIFLKKKNLLFFCATTRSTTLSELALVKTID